LQKDHDRSTEHPLPDFYQTGKYPFARCPNVRIGYAPRAKTGILIQNSKLQKGLGENWN